MTEFYGPTPASPVATLTQARGWARGLGGSGVYATDVGLYTTDLQCTDGGGLDVAVAPGEALADGVYYTTDTALTVTLDAADATNDRIDLVVVRLNPATDAVTVTKVTGTPAASPVAPAATQQADGVWEVPLAEVRVPAGSAVLGTITDVREFVAPGNATSVAVSGAEVGTQETTTSTTYTDLATVGPSVTIDVGASGVAVVTVSALLFLSSDTNSNAALMSFAMSGANTAAATANFPLRNSNQFAIGASHETVLTGLTAGSTTFTAKYSVASSATGTFAQRQLSVLTY